MSSAVWGRISNGLSKKLEKLQNRAARITTGSGWDVRSAQILRGLKWESLADRRTKQLKSLMFKTANNLVPKYLTDKFTRVNTIHRHNLGAPNITCSFRGRTLRPSRRVFVIGRSNMEQSVSGG